jgi:hypothetical protein
MNTTQWLETWKEGLSELDDITVRLERLKHNTDVMLEELDREEASDEAKPQRRSFLRAVFRRGELNNEPASV